MEYNVKIPEFIDVKKYIIFQDLAKKASEVMKILIHQKDSQEYLEAHKSFQNIRNIQYEVIQRNPAIPFFAAAFQYSETNLN